LYELRIDVYVKSEIIWAISIFFTFIPISVPRCINRIQKTIIGLTDVQRTSNNDIEYSLASNTAIQVERDV
jgi:hypothetical protein